MADNNDTKTRNRERLQKGLKAALDELGISVSDSLIEQAGSTFPVEQASNDDIDRAVEFFRLEMLKQQFSGKSPEDALKGAAIACIRMVQDEIVNSVSVRAGIEEAAGFFGLDKSDVSFCSDVFAARAKANKPVIVKAMIEDLDDAAKKELREKGHGELLKVAEETKTPEHWAWRAAKKVGEVAGKTVEHTVIAAPITLGLIYGVSRIGADGANGNGSHALAETAGAEAATAAGSAKVALIGGPAKGARLLLGL